MSDDRGKQGRRFILWQTSSNGGHHLKELKEGFTNLAAAAGLLTLSAVPAYAAESGGAGDSQTATVASSPNATASAPAGNFADRASQAQQTCGSATVTAERFVDLIFAIALHGDLSDIGFIERTFDVKFSSKKVPSQSPDERRTIYSVLSVFGLPIGITVISFDERKKINIDFSFSRVSKCLDFTDATLMARLSNVFDGIEPLSPSAFRGHSAAIVGNNGVTLGFSYVFNIRDQLIRYVDISTIN